MKVKIAKWIFSQLFTSSKQHGLVEQEKTIKICFCHASIIKPSETESTTEITDQVIEDETPFYFFNLYSSVLCVQA